MSYAEDVSRHRRLAVLRHLADVPEYVSNASILQDVLNRLGLPVSYDALQTELHWLREQSFVEFDPDTPFLVVTATRRGVDIAKGLATHPGVQRPRPRR
ncbi:VpaChn25_0724 family phage protein [Paracoccus onubensis]|uniref:ArsR family transcriptional regulator n=1 Tax=Paracoccus onubensis TaxID=1675788 RepID=A0A418T1P6_9RHOB|nr:hypothetical protein [Paracoccus onubensis]RJE87124.1 hypothetical protein D3P04_05080 [Paracoccus onubensis]